MKGLALTAGAVGALLAVMFAYRLLSPSTPPPSDVRQGGTTKIEQLRNTDPLPSPPPQPPVSEEQGPHVIHTIPYKKPEPPPPPSRNPDLPQVEDKPLSPPPQPLPQNNDGVCARYGGHKVTFTKRNGWVSWRCVYRQRR
jgi:hypothetical protein